MSDQYTPTGGQTIFPRINYLKTFNSRFEQRSDNGRIFLSGDDLFGDATLDLRLATSLSLADAVSGNNLVTFSRSSTGTYVDSDGLIKTSAINLFLFSQEFTDSTWQKQGGTMSTSAISGPFGASIVYKWDASTAPNFFMQDRPSSILLSGVEYTQTVYAKASSTNFIQMATSAGFAQGRVNFELTGAGAVGQNDTGGTASIEKIGNDGWYRIKLSATRVGTSTIARILFTTADSLDTPRVGSSTGSFYIWGAQIEEGTAATSYIPTGATIGGAPRFDHDPVTLQSLGLLIEESRTNKILRSENLAMGGVWQASGNASTTLSNITSPDGVSKMWLVDLPTQGSSGGGSRLYQGSLAFNNAVNTFSFYARSVSGTGTFPVGYYNGSAYIKSYITLTEKTQRYEISCPAGIPTKSNNIFAFTRRGATQDETLTQAYIWGVQAEKGSSPTSYIPTTDSTVIRSPDIVTIDGTNFSSWYNQSEGTVFVEAEASGSAAIAGFDDGTSAERWRVGYAGSSNSAIVVVDGDVVQADRNTSANSTPYNQFHKLAGAIAVNNLSFAYNGTLTSDSSLSVPVVNALNLGKSIGTSGYLNGHIARLAYFPTRKTDEDLIKLTT